MKKGRPSTTAEAMTLLRAIEAQKPDGDRICDDPLARALVNNFWFFPGKLLVDWGIFERFSPGTSAFVNARERYCDDFLTTRLREGFDQVAILGAGFDTRAYRVAGIEKTRVFEIDHPTTQAVKLRRLRKVIDPLPCHVHFVPMDFDTRGLRECLLAGAYNEDGKTIFIWQGVTMYLTPVGVDSTLAFIAKHSGPGSMVVFDYFYAETLHDERHRTSRILRAATQVTGEEHLFGIDKGQIEPFLTERGFCDVRNTTAEDLAQMYLTGRNAGRGIFKGGAIVSARVSKRN